METWNRVRACVEDLRYRFIEFGWRKVCNVGLEMASFQGWEKPGLRWALCEENGVVGVKCWGKYKKDWKNRQTT